jgi:hypothetical protein
VFGLLFVCVSLLFSSSSFSPSLLLLSLHLHQ